VGSDYVLKFAQAIVQILVLVVVVLLISRYPDFVNTVSAIGLDVRIQRNGSPDVERLPHQCR